MLTAEQKAQFQRDGIIKLPGFLSDEVVNPVIHGVFEVFANVGIWADSRWQLAHLPTTHAPLAGAELVKGTKKIRATRDLVTADLLNAIRDLEDRKLLDIHTEKIQILFTRPNASTWLVPASNWHLDTPRLESNQRPGVQMFTFLNSVESQGGGTLVVAGSHRLMNEHQFIRSKDVTRRLQKKPFFCDLMNKKFADRGSLMSRVDDVEGIPVRLVEMTGQPGDVYLTDLRILHTISDNALKTPRVMATRRFYTQLGYQEMLQSFSQSWQKRPSNR